jgi:hypothetical protein
MQIRGDIYWQRVNEAAGGPAATLLGAQIGVTLSAVTYAKMRSTGFRATPITLKGVPALAGIIATGGLGWAFGTTFVYSLLGDKDYYQYLTANKSAILKGSMTMK